MEKEVHSFDVQSFIDEIKKRPALWDFSHPNYTDIKRKKEYWKQIYSKVEPSYEIMSQKEKIAVGNDIRKRWKNIRQSFRRELARRKAVVCGESKNWTTYKYFDILTFLTPVMADTPITDSVSKGGDGVEEEESESEQDEARVAPEASQPGSSECERTERKVVESHPRKEQTPSEPSFPKSSERQGFKRRAVDDDLRIRELTQAVIQSLAQRRAAEAEEHDDDKHFLLSLLNATRSVPNHMKLAMRTEMTQIVSKYCNMCSLIVTQPQHPPVYGMVPCNLTKDIIWLLYQLDILKDHTLEILGFILG